MRLKGNDIMKTGRRPYSREGEEDQGNGKVEGARQGGGEVPVPGKDAPLAALVQSRVEEEHLSLRPQPPPPEQRIHTYRGYKRSSAPYKSRAQSFEESHLLEDQHLEGEAAKENESIASKHSRI